MPDSANSVLLLDGLDGSNPLGFLAAVGTLRTASFADPHCDWRMKWVSRGGVWSPELANSWSITPQELVELLASALKRKTPEFDFDNNLAVSPERFRQEAEKAQTCASPTDRSYADFIAAFGCDSAVTSDKKTIQDTALRTMSGAGHQHFLRTMQQLAEKTTVPDLYRSLFERWTYPDQKLGLRWDPREDRRYALRWDNPSDGGGVPTMRGANRLAVEALPLLPTAPSGKSLETTGFTGGNRTIAFNWPVWGCFLGIGVVRSVLSMSGIQASDPDRSALFAAGIVEVYRSQRITVGKYRNFTIARPA